MTATMIPARPRPDRSAGPGLSPAELARFDTFGFLVLRGVFAREAAELAAGFEEVMRAAPVEVVACPQYYAAAPACDEHPRLATFDAVERSAALARLRTDPRVTAIARQVVGPGAVSSDSVSVFNCDTHWHDDGLFAVPGRNVLFMWYLDPLTAETGALRVIPGSHHGGPFRAGLHRELMTSGSPLSTAFGMRPDEVPAVALEVEPGDAVLLDFKLLHASFHGGIGRRLVTVSFRPPRPDEAPVPEQPAPRPFTRRADRLETSRFLDRAAS